jgi:DNA polymerase-4
LDLGREIRALVRQAAGLPCSLGIARNRMLAKMASDASKPNGVLSLESDKEPMFMDSLPIDALPGVGSQTKVLFQRLGVYTVADFKRFPASTWSRLLGRWGESLVRSAAGECDRRVEAGDRSAFQDRTDPALPAKSASANMTLFEDTRDRERLKRLLLGLVERVCPRLREMRVRAQTVTVRVRYSDFEEHTRAATLSSPTDWEPDAFRSASESFDALWVPGRAVRLVGVTLSHLVAAEARVDLFGEGRRIERLERSIDSIRDRFGNRAIQFASSVTE